eukprot:6190335-Pleurochrysis_carterae.AAC.1
MSIILENGHAAPHPFSETPMIDDVLMVHTDRPNQNVNQVSLNVQMPRQSYVFSKRGPTRLANPAMQLCSGNSGKPPRNKRGK